MGVASGQWYNSVSMTLSRRVGSLTAAHADCFQDCAVHSFLMGIVHCLQPLLRQLVNDCAVDCLFSMRKQAVCSTVPEQMP